jgi:hypothetical protein
MAQHSAGVSHGCGNGFPACPSRSFPVKSSCRAAELHRAVDTASGQHPPPPPFGRVAKAVECVPAPNSWAHPSNRGGETRYSCEKAAILGICVGIGSRTHGKGANSTAQAPTYSYLGGRINGVVGCGGCPPSAVCAWHAVVVGQLLSKHVTYTHREGREVLRDHTRREE